MMDFKNTAGYFFKAPKPFIAPPKFTPSKRRKAKEPLMSKVTQGADFQKSKYSGLQSGATIQTSEGTMALNQGQNLFTQKLEKDKERAGIDTTDPYSLREKKGLMNLSKLRGVGSLWSQNQKTWLSSGL